MSLEEFKALCSTPRGLNHILMQSRLAYALGQGAPQSERFYIPLCANSDQHTTRFTDLVRNFLPQNVKFNSGTYLVYDSNLAPRALHQQFNAFYKLLGRSIAKVKQNDVVYDENGIMIIKIADRVMVPSHFSVAGHMEQIAASLQRDGLPEAETMARAAAGSMEVAIGGRVSDANYQARIEYERQQARRRESR